MNNHTPQESFMRPSIVTALFYCSCVIITCPVAVAQDPATTTGRQVSTYVLTQRQLVAMHEVLSNRGKLVFSWDRKPYCWEWQGNGENGALDLTSPVYGFEGNAWYTSDSTLEALKAFPDIRYVHLAYCCRITDTGIASLKEFKSLKTLVLYRNKVAFGGNLLPDFASRLKDQEQKLTDNTLEHLSEFAAIEALYIGDNTFSEKAVMRLGKLKTLKLLGVDDSQVSDEAYAQLKGMLPNCKVELWRGRRE